MKIKYSLYSIAAFSVGTLLAVVVGHTTDTPHSDTIKKQPLMRQTIAPTRTITLKSKKKEKHINSRSPSIIHLCLTFILVGLISFLLANFLIGCALSGIKCPSCGDPVSIGDAHYMQCSQGHGLYSCDHSAVDKHQHEESSKK